MRIGDRISGEDCLFDSLDCAAITEKIRRKAKDELGETEEKRTECLEELRMLITGEKTLVANLSEEFLMQFLRAKKFRTQAAFDSVKNYYGHRSLYPNFYQNCFPLQIIEILNSNICNFLPLRTAEGCAVWVSRIGVWDPKLFDNESLVKYGFLCHLKALQNPVTQINGIVSIVDLQGFSMTHLLHMPLTMIRCFVSLSQDALPIRHKAIHVINNPSIFGLFFALVKPLLTFKIRNRIYFHGYNLNSLHQHVPPCILPEEFQGTQGPFKNEQFSNLLLESQDELMEDLKYGYVAKHQ